MLLSHTEEEALEEVNAHLNRLLRNYGPEDKLAELHYGPLKEALDLLAGLSPQLLQLRDSSLILRNIFLSGSDRTHESGLNSDRELSKSFSARCGKALDVKLCLRLLYGTEDSTSALYGVKMALHFAIYWRPKLTGLTGR
jgi:hypothetical protein